MGRESKAVYLNPTSEVAAWRQQHRATVSRVAETFTDNRTAVSVRPRQQKSLPHSGAGLRFQVVAGTRLRNAGRMAVKVRSI